MSGVILDAAAEAHLLHHFQIKLCAHLDPLCFEKLGVRLQPFHSFVELFANRFEHSASIFS